MGLLELQEESQTPLHRCQRLLAELPSLFSDKRKKVEKQNEELESELYKQIGQLKVELDWLKKKSQILGL